MRCGSGDREVEGVSASGYFLFALAFLVSGLLAEWLRRVSHAQEELSGRGRSDRTGAELDRQAELLASTVRRLSDLERRQEALLRELRASSPGAAASSASPTSSASSAPAAGVPADGDGPPPPSGSALPRRPRPAVAPVPADMSRPLGARPVLGPPPVVATRSPASPPHLITLDLQWLPAQESPATVNRTAEPVVEPAVEPAPADRGRLVLRRSLLDDDWADETWTRVKSETADGSTSRASLAARDRLEDAFAEVAAGRLARGARSRVEAVWVGQECTWQHASRSIAGLRPQLHGALIGDPVQAVTRSLGLDPAADDVVGRLAAAVPLPADGPPRDPGAGAGPGPGPGAWLLGVIVGLATGNHLLAIRLLRDFTRDGLIREFTGTLREAVFGTVGARSDGPDQQP